MALSPFRVASAVGGSSTGTHSAFVYGFIPPIPSHGKEKGGFCCAILKCPVPGGSGRVIRQLSPGVCPDPDVVFCAYSQTPGGSGRVKRRPIRCLVDVLGRVMPNHSTAGSRSCER